ncbi:DUF4142 domain-containing protein [Deinococcus deserti]|uniref:DUF4142 domain-containing protein n=1 Tax=Deinococcus deserti (strain DSM 17065 / CIP 109153 / LMG 22923 / VCD115) TaxID=546414 RepID=C1CZB6_DEIDV|nr:DUF4142 domain-containing protein [Deinococcus deserti]ACO45154.1 Conserved hypothetical protein, precursor [Deinococcus deserti VCD115]
MLKPVSVLLALTLMTPTTLAGGAGMPPMTAGMSTAQMSNNSDVLFMESATISNLTEIATSRLALQRSTNPAVRAFAQRMIAEHTMAQAELNRIASTRGIRLTDKPGPEQRLMANKLATLTGAAFDAMYKRVQVLGHQMTLDLIMAYRTIGRDQMALAYAAKMQPAVEMHLRDAMALPGQ